MLVIALLGIVVAVNILELCEPKTYYEGLIFFNLIHNSNLFSDMFDFPSQIFCSAMQWNGYSIEDFSGKRHPSMNTCSRATSSLKHP